MSDSALVSVVIPAFMADAYVQECVASVLRQHHSNLEVIVVDDHSSDDTSGVLEPVARADPRLKIIRLSENVGPHRARAAGISASRGQVIGFVDADDWIKPDMIGTMLRRLLFDRADIVVCSVDNVSPDRRVTGRKVRFSSSRTITGDIFAEFCSLRLGTGVLWNKLYRREIIVPAGTVELGERLDAGEDYIVNVGAFAAARRVSTVAESLYCYRQNPDSISRSSGNARGFARVLRAYGTCLNVYADRDEELLRGIDRLYCNQLRWDCYRVSCPTDLTDYRQHLAESLCRIVTVRPHAVHSLIHAFDRGGMHAYSSFRGIGRELFHRLRAVLLGLGGDRSD